jgi:hypothetical protein
MEININNLTQIGAVNWAPATVVEEVIQNVRTILTTTVYSVPLDRMFGLNPDMLDLPLPLAMARLTAEIVAVVEKFEPRAAVTKVMFGAVKAQEDKEAEAMDGRLSPTVSLRIKEE